MPTLDWLNRASAFNSAAQVPYRLLEQVSVHSSSVRPEQDEGLAATTRSAQADVVDNLLIQGDNLEALKALLPFYRGQVKCIFIDPPYNTKSAFEHYDDNLEHAQWLSMMLPRLQLLRELLREDGSIWVTIDDNEGHYLKVLMDEVFGRGNFVANVLWQKRTSPDARIHLGAAHDHVLVFAKVLGKTLFNPLKLSPEQTKNFKNPDNDPRGAWSSTDFTAQGWRPNQMYEIVTPNKTCYSPPAGRCWGNVEPAFMRLCAEGRIWFGKDGGGRPRVKNYISENEGISSWSWWINEDVGHNQESKKEINELFGAANAFDTPKPERLLQRILHIATNPGDLVLDSFLGSGTTAAVAHKMGRRWIGIEMGEHAATHCLPRLQKVIDGEQGGISKTVGWNGGGAFRFMRLGAPVFDARGRIHPDVRFATLAAFIWQQETGTALAPLAVKPGTPHLGTHYIIDSCSRIEDGREKPISLESRDEPDASTSSARTQETPANATQTGVAIYLLFNGILGDKRPASGNVLTQAVLDALLALHVQMHPTQDSPQPADPKGLGGTAFCAGQGGARKAGGGHEAERCAAQARSTATAPVAAPITTPAAASIPLLVFGEACRLGAARLKLANVTFKHIPYDVRAR